MNISKQMLYDVSGKSLTVIVIASVEELDVTLISGRYTVQSYTPLVLFTRACKMTILGMLEMLWGKDDYYDLVIDSRSGQWSLYTGERHSHSL